MSSVQRQSGGARCSRLRELMQSVRLDAFNALKEALDDPGIDDIYLTLNFTVKDANAPTAAFTGQSNIR